MKLTMPKPKKRGRKPFHPWDKWFGGYPGHTKVLVQGEDYHGKPVAMGVQLRQQAANRGIKASVQIEGRVIILTNLGEL